MFRSDRKLSTCAEKVVMQPLYRAACNKLLTTGKRFWSGHKNMRNIRLADSETRRLGLEAMLMSNILPMGEDK